MVKDADHLAELTLKVAYGMRQGTLRPTGGARGEEPRRAPYTSTIVKATRRANLTDAKTLLVAMLMQVPSVSSRVATAIVEELPGLQQILSAEVSRIANVRVGKRRVGEKVAERVKSVHSL